MKMILATTAAFLVVTSTAAPTDINYDAPKGGWESIDYPEGTGENLKHYPAPPGGWENVDYPKGTGENLDYYPPPKGGYENVDSKDKDKDKYADKYKKDSFPFVFTSIYKVIAKGSEVRNGTTPAPGPEDAIGYFNFGINSQEDTICYNITLLNVSGGYQSPAKTATHIHQAARGTSGPPRLAFPNPVGDDKRRVSAGCLTGPFTTGLNGTDGKDTGTGFKVEQIERDPAAFFADCHTALFSLGAVRGQLG